MHSDRGRVERGPGPGPAARRWRGAPRPRLLCQRRPPPATTRGATTKLTAWKLPCSNEATNNLQVWPRRARYGGLRALGARALGAWALGARALGARALGPRWRESDSELRPVRGLSRICLICGLVHLVYHASPLQRVRFWVFQVI